MKQKLGYTLLTVVVVMFIARITTLTWKAMWADCVSDEEYKRQYTCQFNNKIDMEDKCSCLEVKQRKPLWVISCNQ
jgi:hypothetical protein